MLKRRLRTLSSLTLGAGLASPAAAVVNTLVTWQVSPDNEHWGASVAVQPGHEVWVRAVVSYTGSETLYGLASVTFQPTVSNWDAGGASTDVMIPLPHDPPSDFPPYNRPDEVIDESNIHQFGRIAPFTRSVLPLSTFIQGHIHTSGSGGAPAGSWLRIALVQSTSWFPASGNNSGVETRQINLAGPPFERSPDAHVLKFGVILSTDPGPRSLTVDSPIAGFGQFNSATSDHEVWWFASPADGSGSIRGTPIIVPAMIFVVQCGSADYNHDGDFGTDADIQAFFSCLGGQCCLGCYSADFNGDGDSGTDADIESFFRVLGGGPC